MYRYKLKKIIMTGIFIDIRYEIIMIIQLDVMKIIMIIQLDVMKIIMIIQLVIN